MALRTPPCQCRLPVVTNRRRRRGVRLFYHSNVGRDPGKLRTSTGQPPLPQRYANNKDDSSIRPAEPPVNGLPTAAE